MVQAFLIMDTGETARLELPDFAALAKACGGTVPAYETGVETKHIDGEVVESPSILAPKFAHLTMWCNEEARNLSMAANDVATHLVGWWGQDPPTEDEAKEMGYDFVIVVDPMDGLPMWMITGDVVITGPMDRAGNDTGLSDEDVAALEEDVQRILRLMSEDERRVRPDGPETKEGGLIGQQPY